MSKHQSSNSENRTNNPYALLPIILDALADAKNLSDLLSKSVNSVQAFGFDRVRFYLLADGGTHYTAAAQAGMGEVYGIQSMPIHDDVVLRELNGRSKPFIKHRVPDIPEPYEHELAKHDIDQFLYIPLTWQSRLLALIVADNKYSGRKIKETELVCLQTLALHIVATLRTHQEQESRLFAEWRAKRYVALQRIFTAINAKTSLPEISELTCQSAYDLFDIDHVGMVQFDFQEELVHVVAEYPSFGVSGLVFSMDQVAFERELIENKKPIVINALEGFPKLGSVHTVWEQHQIETTLIVPILIEDTVIGSFSLDLVNRSRPFTQEEFELSKLFAAQIGVAINNAQFLRDAHNLNQQIHSFSVNNLAIISQYDIDQLLDQIVEQAVTHLNGRCGGIKLYHPEGQYLTVKSVYNHPETFVGTKIPVGEGMAGVLIEENARHKIVNDYRNWPQRIEHMTDGVTLESLVMASMKWNEHTLGVIYVEDSVAHTFTPEDAKKLSLLADQAAIAYVNADLVHNNKQKATRLEKLTRTINSMMQKLRVQPLQIQLEHVAQHAADILNAEACGISLSIQNNRLKYQAGYGYVDEEALKGLTFRVRAKPKGGLTSYIAAKGELFNQWGDALSQHPAVKGQMPPQTQSQQCYSLLAIPLMKHHGNSSDLIGLLRVENKQNGRKEPDPFGRFSPEDEQLIQLFADAVVVAVETTNILAGLQESNDYFRQLLDVSPNGVIASDPNGKIIFVNRKAGEVLQQTQHDLVGQDVRGIFRETYSASKINWAIHKSTSKIIRDHKTTLKGQGNASIPIRMAAIRLSEKDGRGDTIGYFEDLREIQEAHARTDLLLTATRTLTSKAGLEQGLQQLAQLMVAHWNASFCRICLLDEKQEHLRLTAVATNHNHPAEGSARRLHQPTAVSDWIGMRTVLNQKESHLLTLDSSVTLPMLGQYASHIECDPLHSLLVVPLKTQDRASVGVMILGNLQSNTVLRFSKTQENLAVAIAKQTAVLIERARLHQLTERRNKLLEHLNNGLHKIRVEKEKKVLLHEVCRLACSLLGRSIGGLFKNYSYKRELILEAVYGLDQSLLGSIVRHDEGLMGQVVRSGQSQTTNEYSQFAEPEAVFESLGLETLVGVPLVQSNGEVEAILFIADQDKDKWADEVDQWIFDRFAAQVPVALHTAELLDKDQKRLSHLRLLYTINDYIQMEENLEKVLSIVLTGVTAGFGLGFNRAAIFLYKSATNKLHGMAAIGEQLPEEAWRAWEEVDKNGPNDLKSHWNDLTQNGLPDTKLGRLVRDVTLEIDDNRNDLISELFFKPVGRRVEPHQLSKLPLALQSFLLPSSAVALIPLIARNGTIGIMVTDKKFNQMPIGDEEIQLLHTFASTVAVIIDNTRLLQVTREDKQRLDSLYEAGNQLVSSEKPQIVANSIVQLACEATTAVCVRMVLFENHSTQNPQIYATAGYNMPASVRENGLSKQVVESGEPFFISDTNTGLDIINPALIEKNIRATAGFPIFVEEHRIAMWFYYDEPHYFEESEKQALQFYVNQAALAYGNAKHITNLEKMHEATDKLVGVETVEDVTNHIVAGAIKVLQADHAALWAYDKQRNKFILSDSYATIAEDEWTHFIRDEPSEGGTAATVLTHGWIGVENIFDEVNYSFLGDSTRNLLAQSGILSFQGIRLEADTEPLGVLYVNYKNIQKFSEEHQKRARLYAHHASLALKKAQLLEKVQRENKTTQIVARLTALNNDSVELGEVLDTVVRSAAVTLNCDAVALYVYEERQNKLIYPPTTYGLRYPTLVHQEAQMPHNSLVTKMLKNDKHEIIDDAENHPVFADSRFRKEEGVCSLAVMPLKVGIDRVGLIFVNFRDSHRLTSDEISNLELYANQAAIAIYNAQLYEREQKQIKALQAIDEAVHTLSYTQDLEAGFEAITEQAVKITGAVGDKARYAHLVLVEQNTLSLRSVYPPQDLPKLKEIVDRINLNQSEKIGIAGRAIQDKKPILVPNISLSPNYISLHPETSSELAVPIFHRDQVIGVINVEHPDLEAFDNIDIQALEILAKHACVAIEKAESREQERRRNDAFDALDASVRAINESNDLSQIWQTIAEEAIRLTSIYGVDARSSYVALFSSNRVKFEATYPKYYLAKVREEIGELSLQPEDGKPIGVIGRTILTKQAQLVHDVTEDPDYISFRPTTRSELTVPILHQGNVYGVLLVDHPNTHAFDENDKKALSTLAEHAAVAIRNVALAEELDSLANISRKATKNLKLDGFLNQVCHHIELKWKSEVTASIKLYDQEDNVLRFKASWHQSYNNRIDPRKKEEEYVQKLTEGICGWVALHKRPNYTPNIQAQNITPKPIVMIPTTHSEMCVPILYGKDRILVGVLDIQSHIIDAFNDETRRFLELWADQLAVNIRKAKEFEELQFMKNIVGARTALAWMGMASNAWRHSIEGDAVNIHGLVQLIEFELGKLPAELVSTTKIEERLQDIGRSANKILQRPITPPLSSEEGAENILINDLIRERARQLFESKKYGSFEELYLELATDEIIVFASSEWVRLALDLLIDNAVEAMQQSAKPKLVISTQMVDKSAVEIAIIDTGCGIDEVTRSRLFTAKHTTKKENHLGKGLLIVQAIAEAYSGKISIKDTSPEGTTMVLTLPILSG